MSWLNPLAAWWFLLVPALLILYILRPRPRRKPVPSLRLWQTLPQIERSRAHVRRPPRSILLLLQLLLLVAGVLALLQPALTAPAGRHLVILLDASASMQAQDGGTRRFERAVAEARRLARSLGPDDEATLLRVGAAVSTLCSACTGVDLAARLDTVRPDAGEADMGTALSVAAGLAGRLDPGRVETVVISDGAFAALPEGGLPPAMRLISVGSAVDNRAITALAARRPPDGSPGYTAYARVDNTGSETARLAITAWADTVPLPTRQVTVPPGEHADLIWPLPAGTARFTVRLPAGDALALDDQAVLFLPDAGQQRVLINSAEPDLYRRVLGAIPGVVPTTDRNSGVSLTIIEGRLPDPLPAGGLLLVNPSGDLLPAEGTMSAVQPLAPESAHPVLAGLDLGALLVEQATSLAPVTWLDPLVQTAQGPLLLAGTRDGRRVAVLTFDPRESNLPKLASFPLLMANLVKWLDPLAGQGALRPGDPVALPPGAVVVGSDGQRTTVGAGAVYNGTTQPGLYQVLVGGREERTFAVNMVDAAESNLAPQPHPELDRQAPPAVAAPLTKQEYWPPLAALALGLLGLEWLVFCWKRGRS